MISFAHTIEFFKIYRVFSVLGQFFEPPAHVHEPTETASCHYKISKVLNQNSKIKIQSDNHYTLENLSSSCISCIKRNSRFDRRSISSKLVLIGVVRGKQFEPESVNLNFPLFFHVQNCSLSFECDFYLILAVLKIMYVLFCMKITLELKI